MKSVEQFIKDHGIHADTIDLDDFIKTFTGEMLTGLEGRKGSLHMIPTYFEAENKFLTGIPVIAIDAGGTHFRTALVSFSKNGEMKIDDLRNFPMPGLDGEVSATEFFNTIAAYIKPLLEKSGRIGFCFSYATEMQPDMDGRLLHFCKEVQAPEVVGMLIGKTLLKHLNSEDKKIVLLNDTVATLLAGKSASFAKKYSSYIGFILGTGTNIAYIEKNENIRKNKDLKKDTSQIINIESGNYSKAPRTDIDIAFDNTTNNPGMYTFEKMISGGYFGGLCLKTLQTAAGEGVFTSASAQALNRLSDLSTGDASEFVEKGINAGLLLNRCFSSPDETEKAIRILETLVERSAKLIAGSLAAVVLKTGKGLEPDKPVLITIEGTTFYRLYNLKPAFEEYFGEYFRNRTKRFVEYTEVQQSSLIGAALAGLTL